MTLNMTSKFDKNYKSERPQAKTVYPLQVKETKAVFSKTEKGDLYLRVTAAIAAGPCKGYRATCPAFWFMMMDSTGDEAVTERYIEQAMDRAADILGYYPVDEAEFPTDEGEESPFGLVLEGTLFWGTIEPSERDSRYWNVVTVEGPYVPGKDLDVDAELNGQQN